MIGLHVSAREESSAPRNRTRAIAVVSKITAPARFGLVRRWRRTCIAARHRTPLLIGCNAELAFECAVECRLRSIADVDGDVERGLVRGPRMDRCRCISTRARPSMSTSPPQIPACVSCCGCFRRWHRPNLVAQFAQRASGLVGAGRVFCGGGNHVHRRGSK